jgi:transcriptional regulator with XRE-family HTH domain
MPRNGPHPTDKHVGRRVRMRRLMLGMSQTTLGDALGLTFQQVQKYEKGTNRIGAGRLQRISELLQVPVSFFFEGAPHGPGGHDDAQTGAPFPQYVSDYLATPDGLHLTKSFHANSKRKASPVHRQSCRADRRPRRSVNPFHPDCVFAHSTNSGHSRKLRPTLTLIT